MRLLFTMDRKDYDEHGPAYVRPSSRCIAIKNGRVAMVHSKKYHYYKFPGGGIEAGESREEAVIRETQEEAGLVVLPNSIQAYGYVHRVQKNPLPAPGYLVQENYYYLCDVEEAVTAQTLDAYEEEEGFALEWVEPDTAIQVNRTLDHGPKDPWMLEREAQVLELLKQEGYFCNH